MPVYAALDVSMKTTAIHVADATGKPLWQGKAATHPDAIAKALRPFLPDLVLVGLETGPWTTWLWHGLRDHGLPVVCMDARQVKAALSLKINKTDVNDAQGLAQLLRTGLFCKVRVKSWDDMGVRTLVRARRTILRIQLDLANAIRGSLRTFGLMLGGGGAHAFERQVRARPDARPDLGPIFVPLLETWRTARRQVCQHDRAIRAAVRHDLWRRLLMTAPGVGCMTAVSYVAAVGDLNVFGSGRSVAAWIGLTPTRCQSGTIDVQGRVSRRGDKVLRAYLYEAAAHVLTRSHADTALRRWGLGAARARGVQARRRGHSSQARGDPARDVERRYAVRARAANGVRPAGDHLRGGGQGEFGGQAARWPLSLN